MQQDQNTTKHMQCNTELSFVSLAKYSMIIFLEKQGLSISHYANQGETYKDISLI